jgi:hypothetical protein
LSLSFIKDTHAPLHVLGVAPVQEIVHALPLHAALPVPALGAGHVLQAAPPAPLPHSVGVCAVTHPWLSQHPALHEVASHALHAPLWQIWLAPHVCPSLTATAFWHAGPAEQDSTPVEHMLPSGLHCVPAEHATQLPLPLHTPEAPPAAVQEVPADAAVV